MGKFYTICLDRECPNKDNCLRYKVYQYERFPEQINSDVCKGNEFCFRIEKDGDEAERVKTDDRYRSWESSPFMYDTDAEDYVCCFCKEQGVAHKLVDRALNDDEKLRYGPGETWSSWHIHMRECSNCKRTDGPWVPGYD